MWCFLQYSTAGELRQDFDDLQRKQEAVARQYDPQMIQEQIRIAAAEEEMESDAVAEEFIGGMQFGREHLVKMWCASRFEFEKRSFLSFLQANSIWNPSWENSWRNGRYEGHFEVIDTPPPRVLDTGRNKKFCS